MVKLESTSDNFLTMINTKEKLREATNISIVPKSKGPYPGLIIINTPTKPIKIKKIVLKEIFSFNKIIDSKDTNMGIEKKTEYNSANGKVEIA